jgi:hypothetical protein
MASKGEDNLELRCHCKTVCLYSCGHYIVVAKDCGVASGCSVDISYERQCARCAPDGSEPDTTDHCNRNQGYINDNLSELDGAMHRIEPGPKELIQSQMSRGLRQTTNHQEGVKKCVEKNRELKKFIVTLNFTGPIEKILAQAQEAARTAHQHSWDLEGNAILLAIKTACHTKNNNTEAVLMKLFYDKGKALKYQIRREFEIAKNAIVKQYEEGVNHILEALEESSL